MNILDQIEGVKYLDHMITEVLHQHAKFKEEYYVSEKEYRRILGIGNTKFYELKALGKFEKGILPASRGSKRCLYHRHFNYFAGEVQLPGLTRLPIQQPKTKRRPKNGKENSQNANSSTNK
jgi:hypothetical protein